MAKNLSGDLLVASANRLTDGVVVFLDDAGEWTRRLDRAASGPGARQPVEDLAGLPRLPDGVLEPLSLREKIRVSGLTFEAIAADAVRYA